MKYMVASDIHGSGFFCEKLMQRYNEEKPDKLILLGDILYHGPRNALPEGYDTSKVIELLNAVSDNIICVHGNCDRACKSRHRDESRTSYARANYNQLRPSQSLLRRPFTEEQNPDSVETS